MDKVGTTGVGVGVAVSVGTGVGIDDGVGAGVGSTGLNTGFGDGFGAALIATPLFQTSFVPDLTHVNFFPDAVAVVPAFVHFAPALTAAKEGAAIRERDTSRATKIRERVTP
jgi:hypothetical protein